MLISSKIKSGGFLSADASASLPRGNERTSCPCCNSMSSNSLKLAGLSSTIMMSLRAKRVFLYRRLLPAPAPPRAVRLLQQPRQGIVLVLVGKLLQSPRELSVFSLAHLKDEPVQK